MKIRRSQHKSRSSLAGVLHPYANVLSRRLEWLTHQLNVTRAVNVLVAVGEHVLRKKRLSSAPLAVKIDITPLCNLHCTVCVHAHPGSNPDLLKQRFHAKQKMSLQQYREIIDQIRRRTSAVSLYYLGDPLMHPDVERMCRIAADARLNTHINTNFSFRLSDERLASIVTSGLTHLTVCMDGLTQENYQRTRVGGRIHWVLSNLERTCEIRRRLRRLYPRVEVQYIKFQHNRHEVDRARRWCRQIGVDQFSSFWGDLHNYTDVDPTRYDIHGPREKNALPACHWPYFSTVIKYNGDVIPCCYYRTGMQYTTDDDARTLGNVFQNGLDEIWNSPKYQTIRRLVSNPALADSQPACKESFCYGCEKLFYTDVKRNKISAAEQTFESVYHVDDEGIPVRLRPRTGEMPHRPPGREAA